MFGDSPICLACGTSMHNDEYGSTTGGCKDCPVGTSASSPGFSVCTLCAIGYYQDEMKQASCKGCLIGKFTDIKGMSECVACPLSEYNNEATQNSCKMCQPGKYSDEIGEQIYVNIVHLANFQQLKRHLRALTAGKDITVMKSAALLFASFAALGNMQIQMRKALVKHAIRDFFPILRAL